MTWYLATCLDCEPILPQPFRNEDARNRWADAHEETGHHVERMDEDEA